MAYEIPDLLVTLPASTGVLNTQYRFVVVNSAGNAAFPAVGTAIFGVLQNKPTVSGDACTIMVSGISKVEAPGSTVAMGDTVSASSVGRAIALGAGHYAVGQVISGSSGSTGRYLTVNLSPIGTT